MQSESGSGAPARVVFVNGSGDRSGAETVLLRLVDRARADAAVVVASPPGPLVEALPEGVRHVELPPFGLGAAGGRTVKAVAAARLLGRTLQAARKLTAEVSAPGTHTVVNSLLALPAVRLARPAARPIWLVHDTVTLRAQKAFVTFAQRAGVRHGRRFALGRAVAVSEATAAPLRDLGCAVIVRPNGVEWPTPPAPLECAEPPVVGSAALLVPWKGHRVLLEAVARLPHVRCELAGGHLAADRDYVGALQQRALEPDLAGRVTFLGHVDSMAAMRTWDVMVLASTSPEAGPLAVLEAMSIGIPVVATNHGGSAEYLADGAGVLVAPDDPVALASGLEQALDPAHRVGLAQTARDRVAERYDLSITGPAMYRAVMDPVSG